MKTKIYIFIIIALIFNITSIKAQQLEAEASTTGSGIIYNPTSEYLQLRIEDISFPDLNRDEGRLRALLRRVFSNRSDYGLIYLESQYSDFPPKKTLLMQYRKKNNDDYEFESVAASGGLGYPITDRFVYGGDDDIRLRLVVKSWEDNDSESAVRKIVNKIPDLSSQIPVESILDLIESAFPPSNTVDNLTISLNQDNILKQSINITYDGDDLLTIISNKFAGLFESYDLEPSINLPLFSEIDTWAEVISEADANFSSKGIESLLNTLSSFKNYVYQLPLSSKDKALLIAGSIHKWAPNALTGSVINGNRIYFDSRDFMRLIVGWDITVVRGTNWDFEGTNCKPQFRSPCNNMALFLAKSSSSRTRKELTESLLPDGLTVSIPDGDNIRLTAEDFIDSSKFEIRYSSSFQEVVSPDGSRVYNFQTGSLPLYINGKSYQDHEIKMYMGNAITNYTITHIEIIDRV